MKILISSIGSRGDVQPALALALELRAMRHEVILGVPPNFQLWVESHGLRCIPVGRDSQMHFSESVKEEPKRRGGQLVRSLFTFIHNDIDAQFRALTEAAQGCDLIVGCALQMAGPSVAEALKIPYVYAAYYPYIQPSPLYPPPSIRSYSLPAWINRTLWKISNWAWGSVRNSLNRQRAALELEPVSDVFRYLLSNRLWLAADSFFAPAPATGIQMVQTGAWLFADPTPLPQSLEQFLDAGEPPVYFGFGSMPTKDPQHISRVLIESARAAGRRVIISQGWANLDLIDAKTDCISVGGVNHEKLFSRVAAIIHHGGAGTTTAAARAGKPQIIVPHILDQYYWAHRVKDLGVGISNLDITRLTANQLTHAIHECLRPEVITRAQALSQRIEQHGARIAADRMIKEFG